MENNKSIVDKLLSSNSSGVPEEQNSSNRRSGNYQTSTWDFNFIQSLSNPYVGDKYAKRADELKEKVKEMLEDANEREPLHYFELIDDLQRLGLLHIFETEVKNILVNLYNKNGNYLKDDIYATALGFRLFRQHGFHVSPDSFSCFVTNKEEFTPSIYEDTKGMLYLYEASYLSLEGETILDLARELTKPHLRKNLDNGKIDKYLVDLVEHALALPTYWRSTRVEARWFIDIYNENPRKDDVLLELAKLDYNFVQSQYQDDLKFVFR
ncbi:hypothetical protein LIER_38846 [Lithospermum erythrorhizon]|uniref:Terpene synthase N-terminal domain-containing protein n=1 Tax=Lithospermum erythrorhizon TaxID=34254 RepID=A0AAV3Q5G3_LITER